MLPMGFGDDWLRFNGIGENVTWGMYNNDAPSRAQKEQLYQVLRWAAPRGLTATFHWHNDRSVPHLLDVLERVNRETPIAPLRWSVAHLNDASPQSLERMKALGVGWLMQNAFYFRGEAFLGQRGADALRLAPPIGTALRMGLPIGGGTDAHRVMSYNPFVSLQWMLDGKSVAGLPTRGGDETPTRLEALRIYTQGSAWFAHDDARRGSLGVGKLADLAVLSSDYLSVPDQRDRQHPLAAHHGGRPNRVCGRAVRGVGRSAIGYMIWPLPHPSPASGGGSAPPASLRLLLLPLRQKEARQLVRIGREVELLGVAVGRHTR